MIPMTAYAGRTVQLTDPLLITTTAGTEKHITGGYEIVEYEPSDTSVGIMGDYFVLVPTGTPDDEWEDESVTCDPTQLLELIDPERIAAEREEEARHTD